MCVVVVESTKQVGLVPEFLRCNLKSFSSFREMLLQSEFTVYELTYSLVPRLPQDRPVIFTHENIRNHKPCTTAAVTTILADYFAYFKSTKRRPNKGLQHYICQSNVTFIDKEQKDSLFADNLAPSRVTSRSVKIIVQSLVSLLNRRPALIYMNFVRVFYLIAIS